ncbi:glycosyl hydrolase family 28-related protein [Scytonema sp. NUACC26]|uniref:glycoside hydrolase family 55 protein n=1 Tax=Scytonema sp. NUACC26 TaxID=3140176 RepID=UPI0034DC3119
MRHKFKHIRTFALGSLCTLICVLIAIAYHPARVSASFRPPGDARVLNVRDFGATPNDSTDDTKAIQKAIVKAIDTKSRYESPQFVFIPKGTYLISDTLLSRIEKKEWSDGWRSGMILIGESRRDTILKLKDKLPAFSNPSRPQPVIMTGSESDGHSNPSGSGNRAFRHSVYHLTIDVGKGNKGAVGIDYLANNRGAIEDVAINSSSNEGIAGISMHRFGPGPALIKNVSIVGFDYGITIGHYEYHMTLENISLKKQRIAGIHNENNTLSMRKLSSTNEVPAVSVKGSLGFVVLTDSQLIGENKARKNGVGIQSNGILFLKNVSIKDYATPVYDKNNNEKRLKTTYIGEYTSRPPVNLASKRQASLNLPVKETPTYEAKDISEWANVEAFGASASKKENDDAVGIQAAIDSGKPVVYLPNGGYSVGSTIILRKNLKKLIGMQSFIDRQSGFKGSIFKLEEGASPFVILEHLYLRGGGISHSSKRALVIRHCDFPSYTNTPRGTGDLFVEDVIGKLLILNPQNVWARQLNTEFQNPELRNIRGRVWVLGMKTEGPYTVLEASKGSKTEIIGGVFRPNQDVPANVPVVAIRDSQVSLAYRIAGSSGSNKFDYPLHVREEQAKTVRELPFTKLSSMGIDRTVPLYNSTQ